MSDMQDLVKSIIQAQVVTALNDAPGFIEALVKAAFAKPVGEYSGSMETRYGEKRVPYIDWLVADSIRDAAKNAVVKVVAERAGDIEAQVRAAIGGEDITAAVTKAVMGAASEGWRINVKFEAEKDR